MRKLAAALLVLSVLTARPQTTVRGITLKGVSITKAASGGTAHTCGNVGTSSSNGSDSGNNGYAEGGNYCTPGGAASVTDCKAYMGGGGTARCAIYAGSPTGSPLCSSGATTVGSSAGTVTFALSGCGTLASGTAYFIIVETSASGTLNYQSAASGSSNGVQVASTYGTWPTAGWAVYGSDQSYQVWIDATW